MAPREADIMMIYECDPEKHKTCKRTFCAALYDDGLCSHTTHEEYKKDGTEGIEESEFYKMDAEQ